MVKIGVSVYLQSKKKKKENLKVCKKEEEDRFSALCDWMLFVFESW